MNWMHGLGSFDFVVPFNLRCKFPPRFGYLLGWTGSQTMIVRKGKNMYARSSCKNTPYLSLQNIFTSYFNFKNRSIPNLSGQISCISIYMYLQILPWPYQIIIAYYGLGLNQIIFTVSSLMAIGILAYLLFGCLFQVGCKIRFLKT